MSGFLGKIKNIFSGASEESKAREFDAAQLPEVAALLSALKAREFDAVAAQLASDTDDARFVTLERAVAVLHRELSAEALMALLTAWVEAQKSAESFFALAIAHVLIGWAHRGEQTEDKVDEGAWAPFFDHIGQAEQLLLKAHELLPASAAPLSALLLSGRAAEVPREEFELRFARLLEISPFHYRGHLSMLEILKAKWSGSHEEMFAFALTRAALAPEGASVHTLPIVAHQEIRNLLYWDDRDEEAAQYFKDPEIAQEVVEAWNKTVGSVHYQEDKDSVLLYNLFSVAFYLAGDKARARLALTKMDGRYINEYWEDLADRVREYSNTQRVVDRVIREVFAD